MTLSTTDGAKVVGTIQKDPIAAVPLSKSVEHNTSQPKIGEETIVACKTVLGPLLPSSEIPEIETASEDSVTLASVDLPLPAAPPPDDKQPDLGLTEVLGSDKSRPSYFASDLRSQIAGVGATAMVYKITRPSDNLTRAVKVIDMKKQCADTVLAYSREIRALHVLQKNRGQKKESKARNTQRKGYQYVAECPTKDFFGMTGGRENLYIIMVKSLQLVFRALATDLLNRPCIPKACASIAGLLGQRRRLVLYFRKL